MLDGKALASSTHIRIGNLPKDVSTSAIEKLVRDSVNPPICHIELILFQLSIISGNMPLALINLGSHEKAKQAVRELNGTKIGDKLIKVTHSVPFFVPLYENRISLRNIPDKMSNDELHDLFSSYGDIMTVQYSNHVTYMGSCLDATAIYLTEEDAKKAIYGINSQRRTGDEITASSVSGASSFCLYGSPPDLRYYATEEERRRAVLDFFEKCFEHRFGFYPYNLRAELPTLMDSLGLDYVLKYLIDADIMELYLQMAHERKKRGDGKIAQLSPAALYLAHGLEIVHGRYKDPDDEFLKERLQRLREKLYLEGSHFYPPEVLNMALDQFLERFDAYTLLELCVDEDQYRLMMFHAKAALAFKERFDPPALSDDARNTILALELDKMDGLSRWKSAIHQLLSITHKHRRWGVEFSRIIDEILRSVKTSADLIEVIESTVDPKRFNVHALMAQSVIKARHKFLFRPISDMAMQLVRQLKLENSLSVNQWEEKLMKHLQSKHQPPNKKIPLESVLEGESKTSNISPNDLFNLLEACAHSGRLCVYSVVAEEAIKNGQTFSFEDISNKVMTLVDDLKLFTLDSIADWKEVIRKYLLEKHKELYGRLNLEKFSDKITSSLRSPSDFYGFLKISADLDRFCVYFAETERCISTDCGMSYEPISDEAIKLVKDRQLDKLTTSQEWINALKACLLDQHKDQYKEARLKKILEMMSNPVFALTIYDFLEISAHPNEFVVYAKVAEAPSYGTSKYNLRYRSISKAAMALVRKLQLDCETSYSSCLYVLRRELERVLENDYDRRRLCDILDKMFGSFSNSSEIYDILEMFSDDSRFKLYATIVEYCAMENHAFSYLPVSNKVMDLVKKLDLYSLNTFADWEEKIRAYLVDELQRRNESLLQVLDKMFTHLANPSHVYDFLEIASDLDRFCVYAVIAHYTIEAYPFSIRPVSNSMIDFIQEFDPTKCFLFDTRFWEEELLQYLVNLHGDNFKAKRLKKIVRELWTSLSSASKVYDALELCSDKSAFLRKYKS